MGTVIALLALVATPALAGEDCARWSLRGVPLRADDATLLKTIGPGENGAGLIYGRSANLFVVDTEVQGRPAACAVSVCRTGDNWTLRGIWRCARS